MSNDALHSPVQQLEFMLLFHSEVTVHGVEMVGMESELLRDQTSRDEIEVVSRTDQRGMRRIELRFRPRIRPSRLRSFLWGATKAFDYCGIIDLFSEPEMMTTKSSVFGFIRDMKVFGDDFRVAARKLPEVRNRLHPSRNGSRHPIETGGDR